MIRKTRSEAPNSAKPAARYRTGAVARMLQMPVATLRVWERRYGVTQPELSAGGQRLHSDDDVRRLALLKHLTDLGHAIGSLARLDMQALQQVASTHANLVAGRSGATRTAASRSSAVPWRIAVVDTALALRLQQPACKQQLSRPIQVLGPYANLADAATASQSSPVDLLLSYESRLHPGWLDRLQADAPALAAGQKAVLYRFAAEPACAALAAAGVFLMREPQHDTVLGQWLQTVLMALPNNLAGRLDEGWAQPAVQAVSTRRWDDAALTHFARLPSSMACECPSHIAELLMQLAHFEAYSTECQNQNPADAELHGYLQQVAGDSRARFEAALEHVALHEGLMLPRAAKAPKDIHRKSP